MGLPPQRSGAGLAGSNLTPVLCVPGHGPLDDTLALIVAQLVRRHGLGARAEAANALSMTRIFSLETEGVALVCVCYLAARPRKSDTRSSASAEDSRRPL